MSIKNNRITNGNVYVDGASFLGKVEECDLGVIKTKYTDHKVLGMIGTLELPAGIDKITGKFKWNSFYREVWDKIANPYAMRQIQVRGNVEEWSTTGRNSQLPIVTIAIGTFKDVPMGKWKQHDNVEFESEFNIVACKQIFNGDVKVEYDALANIYKVNGVDVFADYHINTGA